MTYTLWNAQIKDNQSVSTDFCNPFFHPRINDSFSTMPLDYLNWLKEEISFLNSKYGNCSELEKLIIISNYLQDKVQYVDEQNISEGQKGIYITNSNGITVNKNVHSPQIVLQHGFGVCEGIASATTLLLNNPNFNLNIRSVFGSDHCWNAVMIDGKNYYIDNTWNITRNNNQYPESLKASSFSSDYLLFGSKTADAIGHHVPITIVPPISSDDYSPEKISSTVEDLSSNINFSRYRKPVFNSFIKK